jgi:D-arginine dehydrogenase
MDADILIVGAGIAGASAGYFLAPKRSVVVLERESQPGYHSTGRSAALFTEYYGNAVIRALTVASRAFLEAPPPGFADHAPMTPRGTMFIARDDQRETLARQLAEARALVPSIHDVDMKRAAELYPALAVGHITAAFYEPDSKDMDVHAIHQGYLRGLKAAGGRVACDAELLALDRRAGQWHARTKAGDFRAPIVIAAAGAWCDEIGRLAGAAPIGLVPKRRTALTFDPPAGADVRNWASITDADEDFYVKPDAGALLGSPADETPVPPQDAQPEELDIALCIERIQAATTHVIRRPRRTWAGLRSFVADRTPVCGFAAGAEGFFWLAGQGGYGIMTSPAMGRAAAALATGADLPADLAGFGLTAAQLGPARLTSSKAA